MIRTITLDSQNLLEHFKQYSLSSIVEDELFINSFKLAHKKVYGYLVLYFEAEKQNTTNSIFTEKSLFYLKESVSDILQSLFIWTNGAYRAADLLLRSSIENFNKAIIGKSDSQVYEEKSLYKIFDMAKASSEYQVLIEKENLYTMLHQNYDNLCMSTHTASTSHMEHITALSHLPKYEKAKAEKYIETLTALIDIYLGFFLANHKNIISNMSIPNNDIFYDVLSKNFIRNIELHRVI